MADPLAEVVRDNFETLVHEMTESLKKERAVAAPTPESMQALLDGVDLNSFKKMAITGDKQVAALNNDDMSRGGPEKGGIV